MVSRVLSDCTLCVYQTTRPIASISTLPPQSVVRFLLCNALLPCDFICAVQVGSVPKGSVQVQAFEGRT